MKFKEFNNIIKDSVLCKFEKRDFNNNYPIIKNLECPNRL